MPSLRKFIGLASPELTAAFFETHGVELSAGELRQSSSEIAELVDARLCERPVGTFSRIDQQIETIEKMATEAGENAIENTTVHENLASLPSRTARALWVFLNDPKGFRQAEEIIFHDAHRYGRQWAAFSGEKNRDLRTDPEAEQAFKEALKLHFDSANVHLDIFERRRPRFSNTGDADDNIKVELVQVTIYREARPTVQSVPPTHEGHWLRYCR